MKAIFTALCFFIYISTAQDIITTHTYTTAGLHTISISGDFPRIYFHPRSSPAVNNDKVLTIALHSVFITIGQT